MKKALLVAAASAAALVSSHNVYAQGCVLIREAAPIIGAASSTYLRPGEWQLDVSFRDSTADRHYSLDVEQVQRQLLGTNVINTQKQTLFDLSHAVTDRFSFSVAVLSSSRRGAFASADAGSRTARHRARRGVGDISAIGRYWVFVPKHSDRNLSVGFRVKTPTGNQNRATSTSTTAT
jgi:hypothetical protein